MLNGDDCCAEAQKVKRNKAKPRMSLHRWLTNQKPFLINNILAVLF
jgi:hypothetical protein